MLAKDAGLYYKDNKGTKCFDSNNGKQLKLGLQLQKGVKDKIRKQLGNMYKYIREAEDPA